MITENEDVSTHVAADVTMVAHNDKAKSIIDIILDALQVAELIEPIIINLIHPDGYQQITVGGNYQQITDGGNPNPVPKTE